MSQIIKVVCNKTMLGEGAVAPKTHLRLLRMTFTLNAEH